MHILEHFGGLELKLAFNFLYFQTILLQSSLYYHYIIQEHFCGYSDHYSSVQVIDASF